MKKTRLFFLVFCSIFIIISCSDDSLVIDEKNSVIQVELRQDFDPDILVFTPCEVRSLEYFVDPCYFSLPGWQSGIQAAIAEYNQIDAAIHFSETLNKDEADFVFECQGMQCRDFLEFITFFQGGSWDVDNRTIVLNSDVDELNDCCDVDACFYKGVVMHELGHVLGLAHFGEGNQIPGTPETDDNSIMNGPDIYHPFLPEIDLPYFPEGTTCSVTCAFSEFDIVALRTLYPNIELDIKGPSLSCSETEYCIESGEEITSFLWTSPPSIVNQTSSCTSLSELGTHVLGATITIDGCEIEIEREIHIGPPNPPQISVTFDCNQVLILTDNANPIASFSNDEYVYNWTVEGMDSNPHINHANPGEAKAGFTEGAIISVQVDVSNKCGSVSSETVCFNVPSCLGETLIEGFRVPCPNVEDGDPCEDVICPSGYFCINGECKPKILDPDIEGKPCTDLKPCPEPYICVEGICVDPR